MQVPVQVSFRNMEVSDAVETACHEEAAKLERYFDRVTSCHVVISEPHRRHEQGNLFEVRIRLAVPGGEVVVDREPPRHHASEDPYVAIREAFDTARRGLEDHVNRRRGETKTHTEPPHGHVKTIFADEGWGFIETSDGRELYFHRNSVLDDGFDALDVGTPVRFTEETGLKGPQASSVAIQGRHGHIAV